MPHAFQSLPLEAWLVLAAVAAWGGLGVLYGVAATVQDVVLEHDLKVRCSVLRAEQARRAQEMAMATVRVSRTQITPAPGQSPEPAKAH